MVEAPGCQDLIEFRARLAEEVRARLAAWSGDDQPRATPVINRSRAVAGVLVDGCASESLPAEYSVRGALERGFSEAALRYFALSAPPSRPWVFSWTGLTAASCAREALRRHAERLGGLATSGVPLTPRAWAEHQRFAAALSQDLDTPAALEVVWDVVHGGLPPAEQLALLLDLDALLGLDFAETARPSDELPPAARELVEARALARQRKDWVRSDELRAQLAALGIETRDSPQGSEYRRAAD